MPVTSGALLVVTFLADGSAFVATARMTATQGRSLALAALGVAWVLSVATCIVVLRAGGGGGGEGPREEPPEPPWWPEFERAFRDYARAQPRRARRRGPREPAGRR